MKLLRFSRSVYNKSLAPKVCQTAAEAVLAIKSNDVVYVHSVGAVPSTLLNALSQRANISVGCE